MVKKDLFKKDDGGKEILMEVGLAVIGVALLLIFRNTIYDITKDVLATAKTNITSLFNDGTSSITGQ